MINNPNLNEVHFSAFDITLSQSISSGEVLSFLQSIAKKNDKIIAIQSFRFDSLVSRKQLLSAVWHAWNGFKNGITISNYLSVEFLLYVSGQRQISKALEFFGLDKEVEQFSVVIFQDQKMEKSELLTLLSENNLIKEIAEPIFTDTPEKRKKLASIFDLTGLDENQLLSENDGLTLLENYILTSISNVVFEASKTKSNNSNHNKQKR